MRNILLIEPNYKNKYPPIGLMKISTYHRILGDNVTFFKGDLKEFILDNITKKCIDKFFLIEENINWKSYYNFIKLYLKKGGKDAFNDIPINKSIYKALLEEAINEQKKNFQDKKYEKEPLFDRVYVATLFTFYWKVTLETINFAKKLVNSDEDIFIGGVSATLLYNDIIENTGITPISGLLNKPQMLDNDIKILGKNKNVIVDTLPLDYSILDEIDYKYPENDAYYGYITRGCIRKCSFCAVPILEPDYCNFIPIKKRIEESKLKYGEKRNLLLLDNNVLASSRFEDIINEIIESGFGKGAKYTEPNQYEISINNLKNGVNDSAYIKKTFDLNIILLDRLKGEQKQVVYNILSDYYLLNIHTTTKDNLILVSDKLLPLYSKYFKKLPKLRYVDFNQGVDARLFNEENANLLGKINIRPLRIAFDNIKDKKHYEKAIRLSANAGIRNFSNYILYNFQDDPIDFYQRLKFNIDLCEELNINIYSFPMKFHPITGEDRFNRDYLGVNWNRKYIRAIQAILNAIKGKVGRGKEFFEKAFGSTEDEFHEILEMPETMILYRYFFEWLGEGKKYHISTFAWQKSWKNTFAIIDEKESKELLDIIHDNKFTSLNVDNLNPKFSELLKFYVNFRDDIINSDSELFKLKKEYDQNPTRKLRRKSH